MNTKQTPGASELTRDDVTKMLRKVRHDDMPVVIVDSAALVTLCEHYLSTTAVAPAVAEPVAVAWLLTDEKINDLQVSTVQTIVARAKHAHYANVYLRINGKDELYQADWIKHLVAAHPPAPAERTEADSVGRLLAIIHGDGGHYEDEHGTEKAALDAIDVYYAKTADLLPLSVNWREPLLALAEKWETDHADRGRLYICAIELRAVLDKIK